MHTAMVGSAVEARRAPGPLLSGFSTHLNWSKVFGAQAAVALKGEDAARAVHVQDWLGLDPAKKRVGKLRISRESLNKAIKKLKRGTNFRIIYSKFVDLVKQKNVRPMCWHIDMLLFCA